MRRKKTLRTSVLIPMVMFGALVFSFLRIATGTSAFDTLLSFILGINVNRISWQSAKSIQYLRPEMIRLDGFAWDLIEAKRGTYDYRTSDAVMRWARDNKQSVVGIIQYAPGWANGQHFTTPPNLGISNCGIPDLGDTRTAFHALRTYPPRNYLDFSNYASAIARRYKDVVYWQIWNEPNNPIFWPTGPDAREYAAMLKAVYGKIKRANPRAQVVLGGISLNDLDYINELYSAGAKNYFDILAIHLYNPGQEPRAYLENELEKLHATMVKYGDATKKIWLTEIGWYTGTATHAVSEQQQGQYLEDVFTIARSKSYVDALFWNTLMDCSQGYTADNSEHNFGIFKNDLTPKPAANVMRGIMLRK